MVRLIITYSLLDSHVCAAWDRVRYSEIARILTVSLKIALGSHLGATRNGLFLNRESKDPPIIP